jgi:hypothetical protein
MKLCEYHVHFLKALSDCKVPFVVIGGMARVHHFGGDTKDLDVWVQAGTADEQLEKALLAWVEKFPRHVMHPNSFKPPLNVRPIVQVHFPEQDIFYHDHRGEWHFLKATEGIDLLTSLPPLLLFAS